MKVTGIMLICAMLVLSGCARKKFTSWQSLKDPQVAAQLKSFVAEKQAQANAATNASVPGYAAFFAAAERGDWIAVNEAFEDFKQYAGQDEHTGKTGEWLRDTKWQAVIEIWGGLDAFGEGAPKYSALYANDIIGSIPPGSIYFGGTDPGRFLITAMQKNQVAGDPFFTLTQNWLANSSYLGYLRSMYGGKIHTPTAGDLEKCWQDYTNDAARRLQNHQLKPGEHVTKDASGRLQISGYMATVEVRARMTKLIFDQNTNREFYVEESFPFDWMYSYLEPHGLIFKLNRQPLPELSDEIVQRDHDYWMQVVTPMIGGWLKPDASIQKVAAFAGKVFAKHDFSGFTGDPQFVQNDYSCKMFAKERDSIAGLYAWRAQHATDATERERMNKAADFAFRQAWALCPYWPETVVQYVAFLVGENRRADALLVAETAANMPEMKGRNGGQIHELVQALQSARTVK